MDISLAFVIIGFLQENHNYISLFEKSKQSSIYKLYEIKRKTKNI